MASIGRPVGCALCSGVVAVDRAAGAEATKGKRNRVAKLFTILGKRHLFMPIISDLYNAPANRPQAAGAMVEIDWESIICDKQDHITP
jgi:hypothetical protein